jgi:hypothetical protein
MVAAQPQNFGFCFDFCKIFVPGKAGKTCFWFLFFQAAWVGQAMTGRLKENCPEPR